MSDESDVEVEQDKAIPVVSKLSLNGKTACTCSKTYTPQSNNLGDMINGIIQSNCKGKKTVVKIQIEIDDE